MTLVDGRTGIEVIDRTECLRLLGEHVVGRVAVLDGGSPLVLPVNYGVDGESIVFRTGPGSKLDAARGGNACFEIDGSDPATQTGWSVVVRGRLTEVTRFDAEVHARVATLAEPWIEGQRGHIVRLQSHSITGRRIRARVAHEAAAEVTVAERAAVGDRTSLVDHVGALRRDGRH